jgi:hypothetical protein
MDTLNVLFVATFLDCDFSRQYFNTTINQERVMEERSKVTCLGRPEQPWAVSGRTLAV